MADLSRGSLVGWSAFAVVAVVFQPAAGFGCGGEGRANQLRTTCQQTITCCVGGYEVGSSYFHCEDGKSDVHVRDCVRKGPKDGHLGSVITCHVLGVGIRYARTCEPAREFLEIPRQPCGEPYGGGGAAGVCRNVSLSQTWRSGILLLVQHFTEQPMGSLVKHTG
jgi:hypothetical protein